MANSGMLRLLSTGIASKYYIKSKITENKVMLVTNGNANFQPY